MLNLSHLSLNTAFAYAGLEAGPSPNQKRDVILQEKGQLAPWPSLIGSVPRFPQAQEAHLPWGNPYKSLLMSRKDACGFSFHFILLWYVIVPTLLNCLLT